MGQIVSLHSKTLPSHNPRAKDGLRAVYVRTCHVFTSGSGVVHGWSGSGTGMEQGLERNGPLQHAVWSESSAASSSQTTSWKQPSASLLSNSTAVPQRAATVSGAGANLPQVEREGGLQAIHSQTAGWQQPSTSLPSDRKSVVQGKSVDLGGRRIIKKKMKKLKRTSDMR